MSEADTKPAATTNQDEGNKALIRLAVEIGPVASFFLVYFGSGRFGASDTQSIMIATAVFMVTSISALAYAYITEKRIAPMPLVTGVIVLVFGSLTLIFQDETFIKMKPTIVNLIYAAILMGGLFFGQLFFKFLFQSAYRLPDYAWRMLTYRWSGLFVVLAILNEVVWRTMSTDFWVGFKFWGVMPLTFVFALAQIPYISKHHIGPIGEKRPTDAADRTAGN